MSDGGGIGGLMDLWMCACVSVYLRVLGPAATRGVPPWRPRKLRPFHLKLSVSTSTAIPGPCEEELNFTLLQLQEENSLQLNVLGSPILE